MTIVVLSALFAGYMAGMASTYLMMRDKRNPLGVSRYPGHGYRPLPGEYFRDKRGVAAIEYAILAGVMGLVLVLVFQHLDQQSLGLAAIIGKAL